MDVGGAHLRWSQTWEEQGVHQEGWSLQGELGGGAH